MFTKKSLCKKTARKCPKKHVLTQFNTPEDGYTLNDSVHSCDVCRDPVHKGTKISPNSNPPCVTRLVVADVWLPEMQLGCM